MARILSTQELIKDNINSYIDQSTSEYSKYLQNAPTFVTYYKRNSLHSTSDSVLESVREVIGPESPILFDKIENFAIYSVEESLPNIEASEFGIDTEMGSEAVIIPGTIKPTPDDVFINPYNGVNVLFRVTDVTLDRIKGKPFYRITYELDENKSHDVEKQVKDEYSFLYDNIGTEEKTVILSSDLLKVKDIENLFNKIYSFYIKAYMHNKFNILTFKHNGTNLYNRYLIKFIRDNEVLIKKYNFLNSVVVVDILDEMQFFEGFYNNTIYYALENMTTEHLEVENFKPIVIPKDNHSLPFFYHYEDFYNCYYDKQYKDINNDIKIVKAHNNKLVDNCVLNNLYDDNHRYKLENIVISYINRTIDREEVLKNISKIDLKPYLNEFLLLPCILFILNNLKKDILNNNKLITDEGRY